MAFPWIAAAIGVSTLFSFVQSRAQAKNISNAAKYDKKVATARANQQNMIAAKRARLFASETLARQGKGGGAIGEGSNAIVQQTIKENFDELKAQNELGLLYDLGAIDNRLMGSLSANNYRMYGGLLSGAANTYGAYQNQLLRDSLMSNE